MGGDSGDEGNGDDKAGSELQVEYLVPGLGIIEVSSRFQF